MQIMFKITLVNPFSDSFVMLHQPKQHIREEYFIEKLKTIVHNTLSKITFSYSS